MERVAVPCSFNRQLDGRPTCLRQVGNNSVLCSVLWMRVVILHSEAMIRLCLAVSAASKMDAQTDQSRNILKTQQCVFFTIPRSLICMPYSTVHKRLF